MTQPAQRHSLLVPAVLSALLIAGVIVALYAGGVLSSHEPDPRGPHGSPRPGMPRGRRDMAENHGDRQRPRIERPVKHRKQRGLLRLRLGFSVPTPIHCALGEIFLRTDILMEHGFLGEMIPLLKGKDQHEAARLGLLDASFTCETPAIMHLDRLPGLALIGSPGVIGEIALVVPDDSDVREPGQLRGRTIAVLGGSSSHLLLDHWLGDGDPNGRVPFHSVISGGKGDEAVAALRTGEASAAVLWDPWLTHQMSRGDLRVVERARIWSALSVHAPHIPREYRDRYLDAVRDALSYGAEHLDEVVGWVSERNGISPETIATVLGKNDFLNGNATPNTVLSPAQMERLRACERKAVRAGMTSPLFRLSERIWTGDRPAPMPGAQRRPGENDLVRIPGGTFRMGALDRDSQARPCERPRHLVTLSDFFIQKYEVTVAEYRHAVEQGVAPAPGCGTTEAAEEWYCNWDKPGRDDHPVNGVSWYAAETYCRWIGMRLPTEAEFEYVLAGGTTDSVYPWGDGPAPSNDSGNLVDEKSDVPIKHWFPVKGRSDGFSGSAPVGTFPGNRYGVHDVLGNVWEWTQDRFGETSYTENAAATSGPCAAAASPPPWRRRGSPRGTINRPPMTPSTPGSAVHGASKSRSRSALGHFEMRSASRTYFANLSPMMAE